MGTTLVTMVLLPSRENNYAAAARVSPRRSRSTARSSPRKEAVSIAEGSGTVALSCSRPDRYNSITSGWI